MMGVTHTKQGVIPLLLYIQRCNSVTCMKNIGVIKPSRIRWTCGT
jgi:hypothetical protein